MTKTTTSKGGGRELLLPARPFHQFSAAIRAYIFHGRGACWAKRAFVRANHGWLQRRKRLVAFFTFILHLQRHKNSLTNANVHQVRAAELRHVARLLARNGQQPCGKRFVPLYTRNFIAWV